MAFDILPAEIVVKIFNYLPREDFPILINVSERFKDLILTFCLNGCLNLEKAHLFDVRDLKYFFYKKIATTLMNLNINGVWWLESHNYVLKCPNLRAIHMVDTKLSTSQLKNIFLNCQQIEDIEFLWPSDLTLTKVNDFEAHLNVLKNIKVMKFVTAKWRPHLKFLEYTPSLIKLNVIFDSLHGRNSACNAAPYSIEIFEEEQSFDLKFPNLKEIQIVCRTLNFQRFLNRVHFLLNSGHESFFPENVLVQPFPNLSCLCKLTTTDVSWMKECEVMELPMCHDLERRINEMTFPYLKELFLYGRLQHSVIDLVAKMPQLRSFHFFGLCPMPLSLYSLHKLHPKLEKLSFWCEANSHSMSYVLGELEKFTDLSHLCVPPCVLEEKLPGLVSEKPFRTMFLFKRPRLGESKSSEKAGNAAFNKVIDNCSSSLRVLEIALFEDLSNNIICHRTPVHWHCLENIKKLIHLTHLTLELIPVMSGAFLKTIATECKKLEFLRLKDLGLSGKCVYLKELSETLPLFKNLRSFRFENGYILPGSALFCALGKCEKLERVSIFSKKEVYIIDEMSMAKLLLKRNLIFAYIDIDGLTVSSVNRIKKQIKPTISAKLFYHITSDNVVVQCPFIPLKHSREMVQYLPWITV